MILNLRTLAPALFCLLMVFPAQASFFDDLLEGDFDAIAGKRKIQAWNGDNQGKYVVDEAALGCGGYHEKGRYIESTRIYMEGKRLGDCRISGSLTNNTNDIIKAVVIRIKFYNKQTKKLVVEEQQVIWASAVPSVSAEFEYYFNSSGLSLAYKQLGDQYSWNFEMIGAVPKEMEASWLLNDAD